MATLSMMRHHAMQPIAAYEEYVRKLDNTGESVAVDWPPSLTTRYQTKFFKDDDIALGSVGIHREFITAAARWMMAEKL